MEPTPNRPQTPFVIFFEHPEPMFTKLSILIALAAWTVTLAVAFDDGPPGRAAVSLQPGGVEDRVVAELNRWIDDGARAEVPIGSAALRLEHPTRSVSSSPSPRMTFPRAW
jgi:hypothetical protein